MLVIVPSLVCKGGAIKTLISEHCFYDLTAHAIHHQNLTILVNGFVGVLDLGSFL